MNNGSRRLAGNRLVYVTPGRFSTTLSALDLATTPFALERAQRMGQINSQKDVPRPLSSFMENYKPYRGSLRAVQAYENRTLLPFILMASKSQSILIRPEGDLVRRRTTPIKDRVIAQRIDSFYYPHLSLEGLDLPGKNSVVTLRFDQDYDMPYCDTVPPSHQRNIRRMLRQTFLIIRLAIPFIAGFVAFIILSDVSRLAALSSGGPKPLCQNVGRGPYPCKINPNPDVAGIGGRIALYIQVFIPGVLLALSPMGATTASWALVFTSTTYVLSAIISAATSQLTLYHVTLVAKMQGLPVTVLTIIEIFPPRERGPYLYLLHLFRLAGSLTLLGWYTVIAPCFGSQPECNVHVVTYGWFSSNLAIEPIPRSLSLAVLLSTLVIRCYQIMWFPSETTLAIKALFSDDARRQWYDLPSGWGSRERPTNFQTILAWAIEGFLHDNSKPSVIKPKPRLTHSRASNFLPYPVTSTISNQLASSLPNRAHILYQNAEKNIRNALRYPKVWRFMLAFATGGILVHSIESTISSNTVDIGENAWTYGQVMAAILTAVPIFQLAQFVGLIPLSKEKQRQNIKEKIL